MKRNRRNAWGLALALTATVLAPALAQNEAEPEIRAPHFEADTSQAPDLQDWGRVAAQLAEDRYPGVVQVLQSNDSERPLPRVVKIILEKDMDGVAYANGTEIHISARYVQSHMSDWGMVVHEMTHLVQRYPRTQAGWLVEGIADYVRLKHYEPDAPRPRINFQRAKYTDAYKTTAMFLMFLEEKYDWALVPKLHAALRSRQYTDAKFKEITGKDLDTLWGEFRAATEGK